MFSFVLGMRMSGFLLAFTTRKLCVNITNGISFFLLLVNLPELLKMSSQSQTVSTVKGVFRCKTFKGTSKKCLLLIVDYQTPCKERFAYATESVAHLNHEN